MTLSFREIPSFLMASRIPNLIVIAHTQFATAWFLMAVPKEKILTLEFFMLLMSTGMIGAAGYIINDYFDQKIDMVNRPNQVVVGTGIRRRLAIVSHIGLSLTGIGLGFIIDPMVGVVHMFSTGTLWAYSGAIKKFLLLNTLAISFLTILTILIVMVYYREPSILGMVYALFGCATVFVRETLKDIISAKGEQVFGIQSIPIVWGIRGAKLAIYLVCAAGFSLLFLYLFSIENWNTRWFFMGLIPFMAGFLYRLSLADRMAEFKQLKIFVDMIIVSGLISMSLA